MTSDSLLIYYNKQQQQKPSHSLLVDAVLVTQPGPTHNIWDGVRTIFFFFQQEQVLKHVLKLPLKPCLYDFDSMSFTLKYTTFVHTRVLYIHILSGDTRGVIVGADAESL